MSMAEKSVRLMILREGGRDRWMAWHIADDDIQLKKQIYFSFFFIQNENE